jgi:hypothetical protein
VSVINSNSHMAAESANMTSLKSEKLVVDVKSYKVQRVKKCEVARLWGSPGSAGCTP